MVMKWFTERELDEASHIKEDVKVMGKNALKEFNS